MIERPVREVSEIMDTLDPIKRSRLKGLLRSWDTAEKSGGVPSGEYAHSKEQAIIECTPGAELLCLRSVGSVSVTSKHERGVVSAFSVKSRSRLQKKIATVKRHCIPLFVTLTYPDEFPIEFEQFKRDLHNFFRSFFRRFPDAGFIWKLEFQKRGAAHYHMLLWGVEVETARAVIPSIWFKVAGNGDKRHLLWHEGKLRNTSHCVSVPRSWQGVKSYVSKYMAKVDERTERSGRFWGVRGNVPFSPLLAFRVDVKTALEFRRKVRRLMNFRPRRFGFWTYGYHPDWLLYIDYLEKCYSDNAPPATPLRWLVQNGSNCESELVIE